jgi:hypothetical protein
MWKDVNLPSELDDPNTIIALILDAMKTKDLDTNYANQKLKSGAGKSCLQLMLSLANSALQANKFEFQRSDLSALCVYASFRIIPIESDQANEEQDKDQQADEAEITAEQVRLRLLVFFKAKLPRITCANCARKPVAYSIGTVKDQF